MSILKMILTNGFIPLVPIMIWNALLTSKLPPAFQPDSFDVGVPSAVLVGENVFRTIIFLIPFAFCIHLSTPLSKAGLAVFVFGAVVYFASWLILIFFPDVGWSRSVFGFAAPAYTPFIWLVGLSMMADSYYFKIPYAKWHYLLPATVFSCFHIYHTVCVYHRMET